MNSYALNNDEDAVFNKIADLMKTLDTAAQYKVLRKVAHEMDRQVVKAGNAEIRVAKFAANSLRQGAHKTKADKESEDIVKDSVVKGKKKGEIKEDPYFKTEGAIKLVKDRTSLKESLKADGLSVDEIQTIKAQISALSKNLRDGSYSFRTKADTAKDAEKPSDSDGQ